MEDKILAITAVCAAIFSYHAIRNTFFFEQSTREAAEWYGKLRGWKVRESDIYATEDFIRKSAKVYWVLALAAWVALGYQLLLYNFR